MYEIVSIAEWNTGNRMIIPVFVPKLQIPEMPAFFLVDSV